MMLAAPLRMLARIAVVATVTLAVSCGNGDEGTRISVGAGDSIESALLARIYADALARTGAQTSVEPYLGQRADYLAALDAGKVQLVGEHTGALLTFLDASAQEREPDKVKSELNKSLPEGLAVSDPAEGADLRPRVLLPEDVAERDDVHSVEDLTPRCAASTLGVVTVPGLLAQPVALDPRSGCAFAATVPFPDASLLRKALLDGQVQVGLLGGPDALVPGATDGLAVLEDEKYAVRAENVVALMRKGVLDATAAKKLNYVAGELTTDELADMIRRIRDERADVAAVAREWLDLHAL